MYWKWIHIPHNPTVVWQSSDWKLTNWLLGMNLLSAPSYTYRILNLIRNVLSYNGCIPMAAPSVRIHWTVVCVCGIPLQDVLTNRVFCLTLNKCSTMFTAYVSYNIFKSVLELTALLHYPLSYVYYGWVGLMSEICLYTVAQTDICYSQESI